MASNVKASKNLLIWFLSGIAGAFFAMGPTMTGGIFATKVAFVLFPAAIIGYPLAMMFFGDDPSGKTVPLFSLLIVGVLLLNGMFYMLLGLICETMIRMCKKRYSK